MKEENSIIKKIVLIILTGVFMSGLQASVKANGTDKITIDKKSKVLIAPQAESYQWFLNGKKLPENGEIIKVKESGEYKAILTDKDGNLTEKTIQLQVNSDGDIIVIYTIGDSTVQTYTDGYYPRAGWGQVLHYFFDENYVKVDSRAIGGTSAKSFYNQYWKEDGKYEQIVTELDSGDYVFIQFGINDAKSDDTARYTEPFGSFQDYLTKYVEETRLKGAIPVIVSTLRKNSWNDDGTVYNAYHNYPLAAIELAGTLKVPLINLHERCADLMTELGKAYTTSYWYNNYEAGEYKNYPTGNTDNTHFQEMGAIEMARLVVSELQNNTTDTSIVSVSKYIIKDNYKVTVLQNDQDGGMVTRTASYPKETPVTLKAKCNGGYKFVDWENESGESISTDMVYTFAAEEVSNATYTANFEYVGYGESEVWIEAEWGEVGALWNIEDDELASNGHYVTIKSGNNSAASEPGSTGQITYSFTAEEGIYVLYLRVLLPSVTDDSFWMKLDDGSWGKVTWDEAYAEWTWKEVMSLSLSKGEHVLKIAYREDGALLDKVHIGNTLPLEIGEIDSSYYNPPIVGINEYNVENSFSQNVWTDGRQEINISYTIKRSANVSYLIYNSTGKLVCRESLGYLNAGAYTFPIKQSLNTGVYILKSNVEGIHKTSRFVIK